MMRSLFVCVLLCGVTALVLAQKEDEPEEKEVLLPQGKVTVAIDPGTSVAPLRRVYWLPDGKHLVTAGRDNAVRLWDAETLKVVKTTHLPGIGMTEGNYQIINDTVLSLDGKRLAVAGRYVGKDGKVDQVVFLLSIPECKLERTLHGHPLEATPLAFAPDSQRLAVANMLWDLTEAQPPRVVIPDARTRALAFSPDGKSLAWGTDLKGGILTLDNPKNRVLGLLGHVITFSQDGERRYALGTTGLFVHDTKGKAIETIESPVGTGSHSARSLSLSPNGKSLLANGRYIYDLSGKKWRELMEGESDVLRNTDQGDFSPDGKYIAAVSDSRYGIWLVIREAASGRIVRRAVFTPWFENSLISFRDANWSADGRSMCWTMSKESTKKPGYFSFRLDSLELETSAQSRAQPIATERKRGTLTLTEISTLWWQISEGEKQLAKFASNRPVLVTKDRVVRYTSSANLGLALFDARTGKALESVPMRPAVYRYFHATPDGRYLLTGHRDQTLTVWTVDPLAPLLNFYKDGNDWIIWTQEGYYAATPGGEKLLYWKVDNGPDKLPSVYTSDRFKKKFHRPDLIKKAFELGSVQAALETLDGKDAKVEKLEDLLPPTADVKILKQEKDSVTVIVTAKAQVKGQPITALRLMLDGMPFPGLDAKKYDKPQAEEKWTITVKIPAGKHTLSALVRSEDASARAEPVRVEWVAEQNRPTLHVLAVGINEYPKGIGKLSCAVKDAQDVTTAFASAKKGQLFKEVVTHEALTDKAATAKAIRDKLTALKKQVNREDIVVVFFAGHGTLSGGDFFFLTHDSAGKLSEANALSGKGLAASLGGLNCRVLLLLDACHAGAAELKPASDDAARGLSDDDVGVTVLSAAQGTQKAQERGSNGLFTFAIKEALQESGKHPIPRASDGRMFVHHLYSHVSDRVGELSEFKQNPFLRMPDGVPPFALRQFPKK